MIAPGELSTAEKDAKAPKLTPEQAAILASASKVETDLSGQVLHDAEGNLIEPADGPPVDPVEENRAFLGMLVAMAAPALPFLPQCYTPEVIANIAGAYSAVEEKYGWNVRGMVGPEFALALFALPPTIAAVGMGRAHFAELRARREAADPAKATATNPVADIGLQDARKDAIGA